RHRRPDAAPDPALHGAGGPRDTTPDATAVAPTGDPGPPLPRPGPGPPDRQGLRPREGAVDGGARGRRRASAGDDVDAAAGVPLLAGSRAGGDDLGGPG